MDYFPILKNTNKLSNKLMQLKIPANIKSRLDEIFAKDGTTTPQGLKMIAIQIAIHGFSPFTAMQYEQYTEPVSNRLKEDLRKDELKMMGYLYDDVLVIYVRNAKRLYFRFVEVTDHENLHKNSK